MGNEPVTQSTRNQQKDNAISLAQANLAAAGADQLPLPDPPTEPDPEIRQTTLPAHLYLMDSSKMTNTDSPGHRCRAAVLAVLARKSCEIATC